MYTIILATHVYKLFVRHKRQVHTLTLGLIHRHQEPNIAIRLGNQTKEYTICYLGNTVRSILGWHRFITPTKTGSPPVRKEVLSGSRITRRRLAVRPRPGARPVDA